MKFSNEELFNTAKAEVSNQLDSIDPKIDELSNNSLKRVIKALTFIAMAKHMVQNKKITLTEEEKDLIDEIGRFQEAVMGMTALLEQQPQSNNEGGQNV